ncbi:hypothetical protein ACFVYT_41445 [Streptomyces sp. NPDC058290]|uniref:hypothetical protein n=1 Tax=Streptomyces sp. NPDC058290 TaxID=3346426 RepID=UPI0036E6236D
MGHGDECDIVAEIYTDVVLDPARWSRLDGASAGAEHNLVGRPVAIRTLTREATVVQYDNHRDGPGWASSTGDRPAG